MTGLVGSLVLNIGVQYVISVPLEGTFLWRLLSPWGVQMRVSWVTISHIFIGGLTSYLLKDPSLGFLSLIFYIFLGCVIYGGLSSLSIGLVH